MTSGKSSHYHDDADLFRGALSFTQAETGFSVRLIEKDYYCSLLLQDLLAAAGPPWAFKGGTCLSKVHSDFCRMSEDLDFSFSVPADAARAERSRMIAPMKMHLSTLPRRLACFQTVEMLRGHNNSRQYIGCIGYRSPATGEVQSIKVEFSLREPVLEAVEHLPAHTLLIDPFRRAAAVASFSIPVLSQRETFAEKLRAALTRPEPAIRDYYDIDHGIQTGRVRTNDRRLIELVRCKLAVVRNDPIDVSEAKRASLLRQTDSELRPVLRETDFAAFDLDRAFSAVAEIARMLQ